LHRQRYDARFDVVRTAVGALALVPNVVSHSNSSDLGLTYLVRAFGTSACARTKHRRSSWINVVLACRGGTSDVARTVGRLEKLRFLLVGAALWYDPWYERGCSYNRPSQKVTLSVSPAAGAVQAEVQARLLVPLAIDRPGYLALFFDALVRPEVRAACSY
jgi:hypothetical protein